MSPEQARGDVSSLGPGTDVWSLGVVLYESLAGRPPWGGETTAAVIGGILTREPAPIRRTRPDVPAALDRLLRVALARGVRSRFPDAGALRDDLERLLRGERPRARPPGAGRRILGAAVLLTVAVSAAAALRPTPVAPPADRGPDRRPTEAEALVERAGALRASDPSAGAECLGRALTLEPAHAGRNAWLVERGRLLWAAGRSAEAQDAWGRVSDDAPEATEARFWRAFERFTRWAGGIEDPDLAAAAKGEGRWGRLARALVLGDSGRSDEGLRLLAAEEGWEAAALRGWLLRLQDREDRTGELREFERALAIGIPFSWAYVACAEARNSLGDPAGGLREADAALRLAPGAPEALLARAIALEALGDRAGALADMDAAIRRSPDWADALANRGALRFRAGDMEGALADAEAALARISGFPFARYVRGNVRKARGDLPGALEDFDAAVRRDPRLVEPW